MRALVWKSREAGDIAVIDAPEPLPGTGEALVRVGSAGICGSDLTIVSGKHPRAKPPLILGHEFMGRVERVAGADNPSVAARAADASRPLEPGTRVVVEPLLSCKTCRPCRGGHEHVCERLRLLGVEADGGFAELVKAPAEKVYPIPDSLSDEEAAIVEPLAVAVHAVSCGEPKAGDTAVVVGGGPVGVLIAQVLRARGVERLWVFEVDSFRLSLARELGFEGIDPGGAEPVDEVLKRTGGRGADITFDAAGVPATGGLLIPMTGIMGRIVMVALHKKPCEVWFRDLAYREQKILGTRIYAKGDFAAALGLLAGGKVSLKPLVSAVYGLGDAAKAFERARGGSVCKVLIRP